MSGVSFSSCFLRHWLFNKTVVFMYISMVLFCWQFLERCKKQRRRYVPAWHSYEKNSFEPLRVTTHRYCTCYKNCLRARITRSHEKVCKLFSVDKESQWKMCVNDVTLRQWELALVLQHWEEVILGLFILGHGPEKKQKLGLVKGTVSRDFLLLVFFMNQFPPSSRVFHLDRFEFIQKFAEIFETQVAPHLSTTPVAKNNTKLPPGGK